MTPDQKVWLDEFDRRQAARDEVLLGRFAKAEKGWRQHIPIIGTILGALVVAATITAYLVMPRAEAVAQHQEIKDKITVTEQAAASERRTNAEATRTNAAAIGRLEKTMDSVQSDIRQIGRAVGARGLSRPPSDPEPDP